MEVSDVLNIIIDEWTADKAMSNHLAADAQGNAVHPEDERACKWDLMGYLIKLVNDNRLSMSVYDEVMDALSNHFIKTFGCEDVMATSDRVCYEDIIKSLKGLQGQIINQL